MNFKPLMNRRFFISCFLMSCLAGSSSLCNAKSSESKNLFVTRTEVQQYMEGETELTSLDNDKFKVIYSGTSKKIKIVYNGISQEFDWDFLYGWEIKIFYKSNQAVIILPKVSGTCCYIEELHVLDLNDLSKDRVLNFDDIQQAIIKNMFKSEVSIEEGKTYLNISFNETSNNTIKEFKFDISDICKDLNLTIKDHSNLIPCIGDIVRYSINETGDIKLELPIGIQNSYGENSIFIDILAGNDGKLTWKFN